MYGPAFSGLIIGTEKADPYIMDTGTPLAQWVKHWLTDLAVPSSSPAQQGERRNLLNCKGGSIAHPLSLSTSHHPDITEIHVLLKMTSNHKSAIHPSIHHVHVL